MPLGQLEARVAGDGVAQLLLQRALLLVVGQFEEVETGGRGGQPVDGVALPNGEEAADDAACQT